MLNHFRIIISGIFIMEFFLSVLFFMAFLYKGLGLLFCLLQQGKLLAIDLYFHFVLMPNAKYR